MAAPPLVIDFAIAIVAALAGGLLAQRFGQPVILGYLLAGVAIGPFTPGPIADVHSIEVLAEIGVAFLMFSLGAEFSVRELRGLGRIATLGAPFQILACMALGPLLGPAFGLSAGQGLLLGGIIALSSTVVAIKVLMARGESQTLHGRAALGLLIAQDIAVVPMVVLLPTLSGQGEDPWAAAFTVSAKAIAVLVGVYLAGARLAPLLIRRVAHARSRELFLLATVALALGTAYLTQLAGLSLAFGAFLAGLVVAESEYRTQVVAEVLPIRDLFISLFFVSVGMLIDPRLALSAAATVLLLSLTVLVVKPAITTAAVMLGGLPGPAALMTGLALGQIGEFSFVLARVGVQTRAIPQSVFEETLAAALVTIVASPFVLRAAPAILGTLRAMPFIGPRFAAPVDASAVGQDLRRHVVICGFGRVGRELADALERRSRRYLVIEYNPVIVRELRDRGTSVLYGDAGDPAVLEHAHLEEAALLAVVTGDPASQELATRFGRQMNPRLDIVARAARAEDIDRLRLAGATDVVQPEFEAGVEVVRLALARFGVSGPELALLLRGRRASFYRSETREDG